MPGISTHITFSRLLLPQLGEDVKPYHFLLGTIAPDTFDRDKDGSFQLHHFARPNGESDLERLGNVVSELRQRGDQYQISFAHGYLAHLWLDNHARLHEDALEIKNPANLAGRDLRQAVRACIEYHDLSIVGDFLEGLTPRPVMSTPGLEFVSIERAERMLQQAREMRREIPLSMTGTVDGKKYREFLEAAADGFAGFVRR